jgi:hypothetical protein
MPKAPDNLPAVGDRVILKGRAWFGIGIVLSVNTRTNWVKIEREKDSKIPTICHLYELKKINA